jgi:hypothetical protein
MNDRISDCPSAAACPGGRPIGWRTQRPGVSSGESGAVRLAVVWAAVRPVRDARNDAAWEREWAGIEPVCSGREHRP